MRTRTLIIAIALLACAATAHAQDRTLERIQNMIATGRLTEARNTLMQWERDNSDPASTATSDDRARALYLAGALTTDAQAAEDAFIGVVLSYPSSPVAAEALLRLGQGLHAAGEHERAITYLERLRSDYPRSPQRETGLLWLTRAQLATGNAALACGTARESLFGTTNENVRTLIEIERDRACEQSGGVAEGPTRARPSDARAGNARPDTPPVRADTPPAPRTDEPVRADAPPARRTDEPVRALDGNPSARTARADSSAAASPRAPTGARPAPAAEVPATSPARSTAERARPLPDLGIAVDPGMSEPPRAQNESPTPARSADVTSARADTARPARTDARAAAGQTAAASDRTPANAHEFAVQSAAFSERRPAETIAAEMRAKGFDVRIVQVPGSPYFRVRYGTYATSREAAAAALHVRDAGFATLIVNDVRLERRP